MKRITSTVGGQLTLRVIVAALISQMAVLSIFFIKTQGSVQEHEDIYTVDRIVSAYNTLKPLHGDEQNIFLQTLSNADVSYSITDKPQASGDCENHKVASKLALLLNIPIVYYSESKPTIQNLLTFWFTDRMDHCFIMEDAGTAPLTCPSELLSVPLRDSEWLNVRTIPFPVSLIIGFLFFLSAIFTFIAVVIAVISVVRRITAPLSSLALAAEKKGRGERIEPLKISGPQELATTIESFNIMHERLTRFNRDRSQMLAAISHDLRTPITSLRLQAEFITDKTLQQQMIESLEEMEIMVRAGLVFSSNDAKKEESAEMDLVQVLHSLADDYDEIEFSTKIEHLDYTGRVVSIKRAIRNFLENAVQYGETAEIRLEKSGKQLKITIQDQGPGVADDKLDEIFEPFYRIDEARNTESGNVGLGLSIARSIIHNHGGKIEATNCHPGLKITVYLPLR